MDALKKALFRLLARIAITYLENEGDEFRAYLRSQANAWLARQHKGDLYTKALEGVLGEVADSISGLLLEKLREVFAGTAAPTTGGVQ